MWNYECVNSGEDYLAHHGILGMKWGVRRYQNSDGTLTSAGRKRYKIETDIRPKHPSAWHEADKKKKFSATPILDELERQQRHNLTKHAVTAGENLVNSYLKKHNYTLNGKEMQVSKNVSLIINSMLDYKYMKDTFK